LSVIALSRKNNHTHFLFDYHINNTKFTNKKLFGIAFFSEICTYTECIYFRVEIAPPILSLLCQTTDL